MRLVSDSKCAQNALLIQLVILLFAFECITVGLDFARQLFQCISANVEVVETGANQHGVQFNGLCQVGRLLMEQKKVNCPD
jgi:hypothetical protein